MSHSPYHMVYVKLFMMQYIAMHHKGIIESVFYKRAWIFDLKKIKVLIATRIMFPIGLMLFAQFGQ